MALKLVVDKVDDIPEPLRGAYVEREGKYHLDAEGVEDAAALKRSLEAERKGSKDLRDKVKGWEKLGKTPDEIAALMGEHAQMEEDRKIKAGEWDSLKVQLNEKHAQDLAEERKQTLAKDTELKTLQGSLEDHIKDSDLTMAIADGKGVAQLLLPAMKKFTRVERIDGKYVTRVVDAKGELRINSKGDPLTLNDLVGEFRKDDVYGRAFESSGNSGSGMRPNGGSGNASSITKRSELKTERERSAFINEYGLETYKALPLN